MGPRDSVGRRGAAAALVVTLLAAAIAGARGATCGHDWQGVWEGKLRVHQQNPVPEYNQALEYLTYWTYTRITMEQDADTFTQEYVGQNNGMQLTCEYTCSGELPVGHSTGMEIMVTGGTATKSSPQASEYFGNCPTTGPPPSTQVLTPNKNLVAICSENHGFDMVIAELPRPNGSWTHQVQYLGYSGSGAPQTDHFINCGEGRLGFAVEGYFRKYMPPQVVAGWYTRGGTYILGVMLALFAGGWIFLFSSVQWNDFQDPKTTGASDDDLDSGAEAAGSDGDSDSDSDGSSGSETGSDSGSDGGRSEGGRSAATSRSAYTERSGYTDASSLGEEETKAGPPAFHCPNCGEGVQDPAATFCSNCGQPVSMPGRS